MAIESLDSKLIQSFSDKIKGGYVVQKYRNHDNKNKWLIICSAMDWIETSVEGIKLSKLSRGNDRESSRKLILFLSCVDILMNGVKQLHKVFFQNSDDPFCKDEIFKHKNKPESCEKTDRLYFKEKTTDEVYFKKIRACFAAHPLDIDDCFSNSKSKKRYASWSGNFHSGDFSVLLYSDEINDDEINDDKLFFDIYFDELMEFASRRYEYLRVLMDEIDHQVQEHNDKFRRIIIPKKQEPLEQIKNLLIELQGRLDFDNNYYRSTLKNIKNELENIKKTLETSIANPKHSGIIEQYRSMLVKVVDEIYEHLQSMNYRKLSPSQEFSINLPQHFADERLTYDYSKLFEDKHPQDQDSIDYYAKRFAEELREFIDFTNCSNRHELITLIHAGMFAKTHSEFIKHS